MTTPKYKIGDWLKIVSSGECCGDNTPSDNGYSYCGHEGKTEYPNLVEIIKIQDTSIGWQEPLYRIRYTYGECNIYEDGLGIPDDELSEVVAKIRKEINEAVK